MNVFDVREERERSKEESERESGTRGERGGDVHGGLVVLLNSDSYYFGFPGI